MKLMQAWKILLLILMLGAVVNFIHFDTFVTNSEDSDLRKFVLINNRRIRRVANDTLAALEVYHAEDLCRTGDLFQAEVDYLHADLTPGTFNQHVGNVEECCRECEHVDKCLRWTWDGKDCWLKGVLGPRISSPAAVSGRVSLNHFLHRTKHKHSVSSRMCPLDDEDKLLLNVESGLVDSVQKIDQNSTVARSAAAEKKFPRIRPYIVINEPRSGSSWLQELSQMHPGIKVQFELDLDLGDSALNCRQCDRPAVPNTKNPRRIPHKLHPPLACGMSIFGTTNSFQDVGELAGRHNASLVILLRRNHVAHAISSYRHFNKPKQSKKSSPEVMVPWTAMELRREAAELRQKYLRLVDYAVETGRPSHVIFYEDMKRHPAAVWEGLQAFLGLPLVNLSDIDSLEDISSSRPAPEYLSNLANISNELEGTVWAQMLIKKSATTVTDSFASGSGGEVGGSWDFDTQLDVEEEFAALCTTRPSANMSWRLQRCMDGVAEPLAPPSPPPLPPSKRSWWAFTLNSKTARRRR